MAVALKQTKTHSKQRVPVSPRACLCVFLCALAKTDTCPNIYKSIIHKISIVWFQKMSTTRIYARHTRFYSTINCPLGSQHVVKGSWWLTSYSRATSRHGDRDMTRSGRKTRPPDWARKTHIFPPWGLYYKHAVRRSHLHFISWLTIICLKTAFFFLHILTSNLLIRFSFQRYSKELLGVHCIRHSYIMQSCNKNWTLVKIATMKKGEEGDGEEWNPDLWEAGLKSDKISLKFMKYPINKPSSAWVVKHHWASFST